eukprot:2595866-Amphidinium_carterae.1
MLGKARSSPTKRIKTQCLRHCAAFRVLRLDDILVVMLMQQDRMTGRLPFRGIHCCDCKCRPAKSASRKLADSILELRRSPRLCKTLHRAVKYVPPSFTQCMELHCP